MSPTQKMNSTSSRRGFPRAPSISVPGGILPMTNETFETVNELVFPSHPYPQKAIPRIKIPHRTSQHPSESMIHIQSRTGDTSPLEHKSISIVDPRNSNVTTEFKASRGQRSMSQPISRLTSLSTKREIAESRESSASRMSGGTNHMQNTGLHNSANSTSYLPGIEAFAALPSKFELPRLGEPLETPFGVTSDVKVSSTVFPNLDSSNREANFNLGLTPTPAHVSLATPISDRSEGVFSPARLVNAVTMASNSNSVTGAAIPNSTRVVAERNVEESNYTTSNLVDLPLASGVEPFHASKEFKIMQIQMSLPQPSSPRDLTPLIVNGQALDIEQVLERRASKPCSPLSTQQISRSPTGFRSPISPSNQTVVTAPSDQVISIPSSPVLQRRAPSPMLPTTASIVNVDMPHPHNVSVDRPRDRTVDTLSIRENQSQGLGGAIVTKSIVAVSQIDQTSNTSRIETSERSTFGSMSPKLVANACNAMQDMEVKTSPPPYHQSATPPLPKLNQMPISPLVLSSMSQGPLPLGTSSQGEVSRTKASYIPPGTESVPYLTSRQLSAEIRRTPTHNHPTYRAGVPTANNSWSINDSCPTPDHTFSSVPQFQTLSGLTPPRVTPPRVTPPRVTPPRVTPPRHNHSPQYSVLPLPEIQKNSTLQPITTLNAQSQLVGAPSMHPNPSSPSFTEPRGPSSRLSTPISEPLSQSSLEGYGVEGASPTTSSLNSTNLPVGKTDTVMSTEVISIQPSRVSLPSQIEGKPIGPVSTQPGVRLRPNYSLMSLEQQNEMHTQFRVKFGILRGSNTDLVVVDPPENATLDQKHDMYEAYIKQIIIKMNCTQWKVYLVISFLVIEVFVIKVLGLNASGYTKSQLRIINRYDQMLAELGEKYYVSGVSSYPVEVRLAGLALMNAVVFIGVKYLAGYLGDGMAETIQDGIDNLLMGGISSTNVARDQYGIPIPPTQSQSNEPFLSSLANVMNPPNNASNQRLFPQNSGQGPLPEPHEPGRAQSSAPINNSQDNPLSGILSSLGGLFGGGGAGGTDIASTIANLGTAFTQNMQTQRGPNTGNPTQTRSARSKRPMFTE